MQLLSYIPIIHWLAFSSLVAAASRNTLHYSCTHNCDTNMTQIQRYLIQIQWTEWTLERLCHHVSTQTSLPLLLHNYVGSYYLRYFISFLKALHFALLTTSLQKGSCIISLTFFCILPLNRGIFFGNLCLPMGYTFLIDSSILGFHYSCE